MTASNLIKKIGNAAVKYYPKYKILPSLTIAQAILESAWGKSELSKKCHNYFGMKWCENCGCDYKEYKTYEQRADGSYYTVTARFRKYPTLAKGIEGYYKFLQYPRYANLAGVTDYKKACKLIRTDGWATALDYTELLITLIEENNLTVYDKAVINQTAKKPKNTTKSQKTATLKIGDRVTVNGKIYGNGDGSGGSLKKKKETMYVVNTVDSKKYKYHIGVAATKASARQGWGNAKTVKKA